MARSSNSEGRPRGDGRSLADLEVGDRAVIHSVQAELALQQRLAALGLGPGKEVELLRRAWWAGPLHVRVGLTEMMLRRTDARRIALEPREFSP